VSTGRGSAVNITILMVMSALAGSSFVAIKVAAAEFSPMTVTFARAVIAALVLWPFALVGRTQWPKQKLSWLVLAGIALIGSAIPFTMLNWASKGIDASIAGILWATLPIFGLVLSHVFTTDDRMTPYKVVSVVLGFSAALMITGYDAAVHMGASVLPQLAVLASALCYAIAGTLQKQLPEPVSPVAIAAIAMTISAMAISAFVPWDKTPTHLVTDTGLAMIYLGVFPTALLHFLRFVLIHRAGYTMASYTGYLVPIFSVFFGVVLLNERLPPLAYAALGVALVAVFVSQIKPGTAEMIVARLRRAEDER